jgi:acetyl esterase/lipase
MQSLASRLMPAVIRRRGAKKIFSTAEATLAHVAALALRPTSYAPPAALDKTVKLSVRTIDGWPVYTVDPGTTVPDRRALYAHGGAWIREITPMHWDLIADLAASTNTRFIVPIFPGAPRGTAATVVKFFTDRATELLAEVGAARTTLIGDSAGGTIALATVMHLRDRGIAVPHRTLLISPALDLSFTDPALSEIAPRDPWLAIPGPTVAAQLWRGELAIDHPMVSPMNGDLTGLGRITLFSGTRDIMNADARRLVRLARAAGVPLDYHEVPEMLHVYPLLRTPEARAARSIMKAALNS